MTVAGAKGKYQKAAIEDTRFAVPQEIDVAVAIQETIDECSNYIEEALDELSEQTDYTTEDGGVTMTAVNGRDDEEDSGFDIPENHVVPPSPVSPSTEQNADALTYFPVVESTFDPDAPTTPERDTTGRVSTREISELQQVQNSEPQILTRSQAATNSKSQIVTRSQAANEVELSPGTELSSSEQEMLRDYQERFKSKEFLLSHAQGLPTSITQNAYSAEECSFLANCEHISRVPSTANVISSHVLYKIKELDDGKLLCKARIAPHGNKDFERDNLKTDSASCPPLGVRILLSICTILHWFPSKVDIKSAFLQSGPATRDVYVIPPRECPGRQFRWRLLVATYGLVNANAKWQLHSDTTLLDLGLHAVVLIPQLFYMKRDGKLCLIVAKVVDDFLIGGTKSARKWLIEMLKEKYSVGTIAHLPGSFSFFGLLITQEEDGTITVSAEEKLQAITPHLLSRMRRKEGNDLLNAIEAHSFASINGSMGFLGQNVSPFASFYNSFLQQRRGHTTVHDLIKQGTIVKKLRTLGTQSTFRRPTSGTFDISVVMFSDAGRPSEHGQLGYIGGILLGPLRQGSIFHTLTWRSHLSNRPTKSSGSAETLAAGDAIDDGKLIVDTLNILLTDGIHLVVVVDCKDLFTSLSTCRNPVDKSMRADVSLIRYNYETRRLNRLIWTPGSLNPADVLTKLDSALTDSVQLMMFHGTLPYDMSRAEIRDSAQPLG